MLPWGDIGPYHGSLFDGPSLRSSIATGGAGSFTITAAAEISPAHIYRMDGYLPALIIGKDLGPSWTSHLPTKRSQRLGCLVCAFFGVTSLLPFRPFAFASMDACMFMLLVFCGRIFFLFLLTVFTAKYGTVYSLLAGRIYKFLPHKHCPTIGCYQNNSFPRPHKPIWLTSIFVMILAIMFAEELYAYLVPIPDTYPNLTEQIYSHFVFLILVFSFLKALPCASSTRYGNL